MEQLRKAAVTASVPDVANDVATEGSRQPARPAKQIRKHALLVEATTSSLRLCREILERSGFETETAKSGIAALTFAREHNPDVIVMDLQLPDVPGREFISWVRDIPVLRSTPVIVLAGASGETADLAKLGPNTLLRRPASALVIHRAIREAVKLN